MGVSQSRVMEAGPGVDRGAAGVFGWEKGADDAEREEASEADLSVTGVGGGALTECLADTGGAAGCVEAEAGRGFKKGTGVATGVFLRLAAVLPHSF